MSYIYSLRSYRHLLGVGLLTAICFRVSAQTAPDTTRISYSEETIIAPATEPPMRLQPENHHLWKLGLTNIRFLVTDQELYYFRYGIDVAYEHKLKDPSWTVLGEVTPALTSYRSAQGRPLSQKLGLNAQVAGRYYYNLNRRLRLGKNISNFSADYLSAGLGAGLEQQIRETQQHYVAPSGSWLRVNATVLYGLQRRIGRYGFIDYNFGVGAFLSDSKLSVRPAGHIQLGFAFSSLPAAAYVPKTIPFDKDVALQPKAYAGFQLGAYLYRVRYAEANPYRGATPPRRGGVGTYDQPILMPYAYVGYYVLPRLAVQVGMQREREEYRASTPEVLGLVRDSITNKNDFALPVMLRYSLKRSFLKRWQLDVVGGVVSHWSSVSYQEREFLNEELSDEYGFQRSAFGLHASAGLQANYGFGRRRRLQATTEFVLTKDLSSSFDDNTLQWGFSFIGLRYRFGYQ
jgi:hypothetical protein